MRVTLLAPLVTPLRPAQQGGSQTVIAELARGLVEAGDDVELIAARGSRAPGLRLWMPAGPFPADLIELDGPGEPGPPDARGQIVAGAAGWAHSWPTGQIGAWLRIISRLQREPADVVHGHAFDWAAVHSLAASGLPSVHTLHLPPLDPAVVACAAAAARRRPGVLMVAVSRASAAAWRPHLRVDAVITNGLDPASVPFSGRPDRGLAVIAGRISPEKGTHLALAAVRRAGMRAVVAGPVYHAAYHRDRIVPQLGDGGAVHVGHLSRARLVRLLGRAAVAVLAPLWDEPFGMVALEANLAGTPVAGLSRGGLPEVVGDWGGVLTEVASDDGLSRAIIAAVGCDRAAVRTGAARRHSRALMVARYRAVYASAAEERR